MSDLLKDLVQSLQFLPGVGPKSAMRMALHILQRSRDKALRLGTVLQQAVEHIGYCALCNTLSEHELCKICTSEARDQDSLCIVEKVPDMLNIEASKAFQGLYFVLKGPLSALDGMGPEETGINKLLRYIAAKPWKEVVLATSTTVDGEATAYYISQHLMRLGVLKVSRIAHGVPAGGELDYLDLSTISQALSFRREMYS